MSRLFLSDKDINNTIESYLPHVTVKSQLIYITVILAIIISLALLPFIYVNMSVQSPGIIRPAAEKTEVRTLVAGTIDSIRVINGQKIQAGQPLVILDNTVLNSKIQLNYFQQQETTREIHDLKILTGLSETNYDSVAMLISALYQRQYSQFIYSLSNNLTTQKKRLRDLNINKRLYDSGKVVSLQDLEDKKYAYNLSQASFNTTFEQQISTWQGDLTNAKMALSQLQSEQHELAEQKNLNTIKAPVSGTIQQFQGLYQGSYIQAGDQIGIISPDSTLIAECYVKPADIGLIKKNMNVHFQVDAFNYNQWGLLKGTVAEITNDFINVNNSPVFIVRCKLYKKFLTLKNGYKGEIKKGMTLRGRFIVIRRSLYELLYDKMSNWLNPHQQ